MTDVKTKTPNKRKSLPNTNGPASAKKTKQTPTKAPQTPKGKQNGSPQKSAKKLQKFPGTGKPETGTPVKPTPVKATPQKQAAKASPQKPSPQKKAGKPGQKDLDGKKKRRGNILGILKDGVKAGVDLELAARIEKKIQAIKARDEPLTKTAKRKLGALEKLKARAEGVEVAKPVKVAKAGLKKAKEQKKAAAKKPVAKAAPVAEEEDDDEDDDLEEEDSEDVSEEEDDDESLQEEEEVPSEPVQPKPPQPKKEKPQQKGETVKQVNVDQLQKSNIVQKNQKRYVVFVGNIPFDTNQQELREHFTKVGNVRHIRLPTEKGSNRPRGFAYVEVENEDSYQKCLSLHHSMLRGRRINVLYTEGGKKKGEDQKKKIKAKNFKLHALRNQGKLSGSTKATNKRSFRRAKQRKGQEAANASASAE